jgi:hypothetical protein
MLLLWLRLGPLRRRKCHTGDSPGIDGERMESEVKDLYKCIMDSRWACNSLHYF